MSSALKAQQSEGFELTRESWSSAWPEAKSLTAAHAIELGEALPDADEAMLKAMNDCGALHIYGARQQGKLVGYICWNVGRNPEQKGRIMAEQGPWYSQPGSLAGRDLFLFSLDELAALGVHSVIPHRRWNMRGGEALEKFFVGLGAKPLDVRYELQLKGNR